MLFISKKLLFCCCSLLLMISSISIFFFFPQKSILEQETSCIPEKSLDKGEIFARAMQQYWQEAVLFSAREPTSMDITSNHTENCGVRRQFYFWGEYRVYNDTCYPKVIDKSKNQEYYYNPYNTLLFLPEHYNKDTHFSISIDNGVKYFYNKNCCKLITYNELQRENEEYQKQEQSPKDYIYKSNSIIDNNLNRDKLYFLRIQSQMERFNIIHYYPTLPCGKVIIDNIY